MNKMPKVSIIVPIYNVAQYLPKCLDSLIGQTLTDIEIICVNDCSPDNAREIIKAYIEKDPRIILIDHEKNFKTAAARNSGLKIACGEYVAFCDGDDYLEQDFCEKLYTAAKQEDADIAKGLTRVFSFGEESIYDNNDKIIENKFNFIWHHSTALYKREMLYKHNITFVVDCICFQIQSVYYANKLIVLSDAFYNYVRRGNSCDSSIISLEKWQDINICGANFVLNFINSIEIDERNYLLLVKNLIYPLYFYGFKRLLPSDVPTGVKILHEALNYFWSNVHYDERLKNEYIRRYSQDLARLKYQQYPQTHVLHIILKVFFKIKKCIYNEKNR